MKLLCLDFETYYGCDYSLQTLTVPQYVHDPRFHVHGLAVCYPDGQAEFRSDVDRVLGDLRERFGPELEAVTVVGHNLMFDLYVLSKRYHLVPRYFVDTLCLATQVHGRTSGNERQSLSLAALAEKYHVPQKGSLGFMNGVRVPNAQQLADLANYARGDVAITVALAEKLLPQIARPEIELPLMMQTIRSFVTRGIQVDLEALSSLEEKVIEDTEVTLKAVGDIRENISGDGSFVRRLEVALARTGRLVSLKQGKNGLIPATAKTDAAMQSLLEDDDPAVAALARARLEVKSENQKLARIRRIRAIASAAGGMIPPFLRYYGAHTGRFAGGGGLNLQNLGTKGIAGEIRHVLKARQGHIFVIGDLSKIEARVVAWVAGCGDLLQAFRENRDIYSDFASGTFNISVHKPRETDSPEERKRVEGPYQIGKAAVLGLGYQMGALKFMNQLRARPETARFFTDGTLSPQVCANVVTSYRRSYPEICSLWKALNDAALDAARGMEVETHRLRFVQQDGTVRLYLPSTRFLRYPNLRIESDLRTIRFLDRNGEEAEFSPDEQTLVYGPDVHLYGGKLTENVVQAIARDLLVETILRLEELGFPVLFHVHDEIVLEVPEQQAASAQAVLLEEMRRAPAWAGDLPLDAEVTVSPHYTK